MPQHCDPDALALAAMGEPDLSPADRDHLATCDVCSAEFTSLRQVVSRMRESRDIELIDPPNAVWQSITASMKNEPVSLGDRRRSQAPASWTKWLPLGVAAAVGAVLGGLVTGVATVDRQDAPPPTEVVAQAQLAALPDGVDTVGRGSAVFEKDVDGDDLLVVNTSGLENPQGFYEVWLLNPRTSGLIAVGTVGSGAQEVTFPVPAGIDPAEFSVVDISDEPLDGDPTHSKVSVLRGALVT
jgi:hypothetical protein